MSDNSHAELMGGDRAERIQTELQRQQHLFPTRPVADALAQVRGKTGFCPQAATAALETLGIDPERKIGRLRRTEIAQLARSIHRLWRQSLTPAGESQPV